MDKKAPTASVSTLQFEPAPAPARYDTPPEAADAPHRIHLQRSPHHPESFRSRLDHRSTNEKKSDNTTQRQDDDPRNTDDNKKHMQLWRNLSSIRLLLSSYAACLVFSVLYCLFIWHVLILGRPQVGGVLFDASTSNLLVSVFSQVFALLADALICGLLDVLRAALAGREGGTSASSFFGISGATGWMSVFRLATLIQHTVRATFDYYFRPGSVSTAVYAGLVPIDIRLLQNVRSADLWIYFQSFTSILLGHPRYSVPFSLGSSSCVAGDSNCAAPSYLLPGGLEMARQVSPHLNLTVFHGGIFDDADVINVDRSRGMVLNFETVPLDYAFDWPNQCLYAGTQINDSVQICAAQAGESVIAGWTSCPQSIFDAHACDTNTSWKHAPMPWTTKMTAFFQPTSVTYDRKNGSIISARPHPIPVPRIPVPLSAPDYLTLYRKILVYTDEDDKNNCQKFDQSCSLATAKINSITYDIAWLHRTYQVSFPDQADAPVAYLRNFLAVPLQFGVVAVEYANYTQDANLLKAFFGGDGLPLPEEMRTLAVGGSSASMLVIQEWTGWAFIGGAVVMLILVTAGMAWVLGQPVRVIGGSGIPEIDILRFGGEGEGTGVGGLPGSRLEDNVSGWRLAAALRGWGVVSVRGERMGLVAVPRGRNAA
ncbi:hypothetical protein QBC47DRAFT_303914 [Echria macrotheca]|uniref:Uncharacterized protein n=1 Tax=Echria macrotheca TaxID=438768 RepID=A0AAJ0BBL8_9PEZI|nr:hypothetical protein QBC47DRAFT_303914 [Echria macrotheca]